MYVWVFSMLSCNIIEHGKAVGLGIICEIGMKATCYGTGPALGLQCPSSACLVEPQAGAAFPQARALSGADINMCAFSGKPLKQGMYSFLKQASWSVIDMFALSGNSLEQKMVV